MKLTEGNLQSLLERIETRERAARRHALLYTLVPILVAVILIGFSARQVILAERVLAAVNGNLSTAGVQLAETQKELARARQELNTTEQGLSAAQGELKNAQQQLATAQNQLASAREELASTQQQLTSSQAQLTAARQEVGTLTAQIDQYQQQVDALNQTVAQAQSDLKAAATAANIRQEQFTGRPSDALPTLSEARPKQSLLLQDLLASQSDVSWKLGGMDAQAGFNSPGFAAYMLRKHKLINQPLEKARYNLRELLPSVKTPLPGDLVFYKQGYTMFYFLDPSGKPFVIGMTPDGILALQLEFAEVEGYGRVSY